MMAQTLLCWGIIYTIIAVCIRIIKYFDKGLWNRGMKECNMFLGISGVNGFLISQMQNDVILLSVVAGCLLFACITDYKTYEVYQFTWWIAGVAGSILLCQQMLVSNRAIWYAGLHLEKRLSALILYIILQELFFCRFYGRADCHAFAICAVVGCAYDMGMTEYLFHMVGSLGGLFIVQVFHKNISHSGNLIRPVAFLPYITLSFWVLLFFEKSVILKRISEINL